MKQEKKKRKMTIGLFNDSFYPMIDGVVSVVDNYAKRLSKEANVIVFAPRYHGKTYDDSKLPYKVVRCKSIKIPLLDYSLPLPKMDKNYQKELMNTKLDIVHIHSPFSLGKSGINYAKKHHITAIGTMHSQFKQDFLRAVKFNFLANLLLKVPMKQFYRCDECWAVNSEIARIFHEEYHYRYLPKVMPNATEMVPLEEDSFIEMINQKYQIKPDEKVFLFVGRINALKNIFLITESLKILKEKGSIPFKMLFVGSGQDEEQLQKWIVTHQMENDIMMCGRITNRKELAAYYKRADLFLFPSLYDASSIVQIEAASQKTPAVFVKGAATASNIKDGVNGFIAENTKEGYAEKIIEIMQNDPLYLAVKEQCYNDLYYHWDTAIQDVLKRYQSFIK